MTSGADFTRVLRNAEYLTYRSLYKEADQQVHTHSTCPIVVTHVQGT